VREILEALLAPFAPLDRVRPRRLNDAELLAFAGLSRHALYRAIASGVLVPERAPERGSRCYLTLSQVAEWRASRFNPEHPANTGPIQKVKVNEKPALMTPAEGGPVANRNNRPDADAGQATANAG
jgi:hypothetical protein